MITEIATLMFGHKSHISTDWRHGFVRKWSVTDAAHHDEHELGALLDKTNTGSGVWAGSAYRSKKNEKRIARAGLTSKVHFRRAPGTALPAHHQRAIAAHSKIRRHVEHPFAEQKHRMRLFIRTIGIARAKAKIGLANLAFNMKHSAFWERRLAKA